MVMPSAGISTPLLIALAALVALLLLAIVLLAVRRRGGRPAAAPVAAAEAGLDVTYADGVTKAFRITEARTTIGRADDNRLVLRDDEASSYHAEIVASREGFLLRDLGSANGTTVNGRAVTEGYLSAGDEIGIGTTRIVFGE